MAKLRQEDIKTIRKGDWYKNSGKASIDQSIIEETIKNLNIIHCPICGNETSHKDNSGNTLPLDTHRQQKYCSNENYILELSAHEYAGNGGRGTTLQYNIWTDSKNSKLIADSGELADLKKRNIILGFSLPRFDFTKKELDNILYS